MFGPVAPASNQPVGAARCRWHASPASDQLVGVSPASNQLVGWPWRATRHLAPWVGFNLQFVRCTLHPNSNSYKLTNCNCVTPVKLYTKIIAAIEIVHILIQKDCNSIFASPESGARPLMARVCTASSNAIVSNGWCSLWW